MILGSCPWCDAFTSTPIATGVDLPVFSEEVCESCGKTYWLEHSRVAPKSYRERPEGLVKRAGPT